MITVEQRQLRRKFLGGSDAPAVIGVDPNRSAHDVYLDKTGQLEDFRGNANIERGVDLEPAIMSWAERELGRPIERDVMIVHKSNLLAANFDGLLSETESIEAKSSVLTEEWGDQGTDQVPDRVIVQVHHGFACRPSLRVCYVPVLLPGFRSFDFRMYRVERNRALVESVEAIGIEFMERNVKLGIAPSDSKPSIEVLKRMKRFPGKFVDVPIELVLHWEAAKLTAKTARDIEEAAKADVIAALGDAEGGRLEDRRQLTYMETKRRAYEVAESTYRTLKILKAR
jgi:putative phage-type endonuclease